MPAHAHLGWVNPVIAHDFPDPGVRFDPRIKCLVRVLDQRQREERSVQLFLRLLHLASPRTGRPPGTSAPVARPAWFYLGTRNHPGASESRRLADYHFITAGPLVDHPETGGCLDPQPFEDPISGKRFLVYKADEDHMHTRKNQVWIWELGEDGISLVGNRRPLLRPTQPWQGNLIEAPYLTYHQASNSYCLFYSSGTFTTEGYAPSFAISRNGIFGPYEPATSPLLFTDNVRGIKGPGGA